MTKRAVLLALTLLLVAGCGANGDDGDASSTTATTALDAQESATSVTTMSIPELEATSTASGAETPDAGAGTILMLKLRVGDIDDAEHFYGSVFGASPAYDLGDDIRVMTFADGPGLILLGGDPPGDDGSGSFVMQVGDLEATQALALENGATSAESFEGAPGGEQARSVRLYDPWGNGVEILQLG